MCDAEPVKAEGCRVWDKEVREYLTFTAVMLSYPSDIHTPPKCKSVENQVAKIGFYSNSLKIHYKENLFKSWVQTLFIPIIHFFA